MPIRGPDRTSIDIRWLCGKKLLTGGVRLNAKETAKSDPQMSFGRME